jgi:Zn finger protein HypA/HybF involved in hydrogenase expression
MTHKMLCGECDYEFEVEEMDDAVCPECGSDDVYEDLEDEPEPAD